MVPPWAAGAKGDEAGGLFPAQGVAGSRGAAVDRRGGEKRSRFWLGRLGMGFEGWVGVQ